MPRSRSPRMEKAVNYVKEDMARIRQGGKKRKPRVTNAEAEDELLRRLKNLNVALPDMAGPRKKKYRDQWGLF